MSARKASAREVLEAVANDHTRDLTCGVEAVLAEAAYKLNGGHERADDVVLGVRDALSWYLIRHHGRRPDTTGTRTAVGIDMCVEDWDDADIRAALVFAAARYPGWAA